MDNAMKGGKAAISTKKLGLARDTVRVLRVKTDVRTGYDSQMCRMGGSGIASGGGGISDTGIIGIIGGGGFRISG